MSSFQRLFCTLLYVAGTVDSVLIKGGVPISGVCIREVPLYMKACVHGNNLPASVCVYICTCASVHMYSTVNTFIHNILYVN